MKKLTYLLASAAMLAACQSQPTSYKITGTAEEGTLQDSTLAILTKVENGAPVYIDTVQVQNNQFVFEGKADSVEMASINFVKNGAKRPYNNVAIVLENGNINVTCAESGTTLNGTTNNDLLGKFMQKTDSVNAPVKAAYEAVMDTTLSKEERDAKMMEVRELSRKAYAETENLYKAFIQENIGNILGYTYFTRFGSSLFTVEEREALIPQVPANYANSETIQRMKESIEIEKKTAVGQKFTDFAMKTPEGKDLKLSDVVAKNKVTLVDFWASWCGPCRMEMPNVVKDYKTFKSKGLGIVGVSLDNDAEAWKKAIKDLGITWEQMSDLKGWECEGAKLYNVRGIPATVLIAQDGTIIAKDLRGEELTNKLQELLK